MDFRGHLEAGRPYDGPEANMNSRTTMAPGGDEYFLDNTKVVQKTEGE